MYEYVRIQQDGKRKFHIAWFLRTMVVCWLILYYITCITLVNKPAYYAISEQLNRGGHKK